MDELHVMMSTIYLDWRNNYASVETFARCYGIEEKEAKDLIDLSRRICQRGNIWS